MATCECKLASSYNLGLDGIISANLRSNVAFTVTEGGLVLYGAAMGDLSITAYASRDPHDGCPGRAGTGFEWMQKLQCDGEILVHFIPNGRAKAYMEGDTTNISMTRVAACNSYKTFSASASSGPNTLVYEFVHDDGYDLHYSGGPIAVSPDNGKEPTTIGFLTGILPTGSTLYMTNFSCIYMEGQICLY